MRINRNNGIMETSPCKDYKQGQGQGLDHKDQDKDKDLTHKDQDKDKNLTPKDQDKNLKNVLKESLRTRTRTRINIPASERMKSTEPPPPAVSRGIRSPKAIRGANKSIPRTENTVGRIRGTKQIDPPSCKQIPGNQNSQAS